MTIKIADWSERRAAVRKHFTAKGWIRLPDGREIEARTFDASLMGAGVAHEEKLKSGTLVLLGLAVLDTNGNPQIFQAEAEVRHTLLGTGGQWRTGLQFRNMTTANRDLLQQCLSRKLAWVD